MLKRHRKTLCSLILAIAVASSQLLPVFNIKTSASIGGTYITGSGGNAYTHLSEISDYIDANGYIKDEFTNAAFTNSLFNVSENLSNSVVKPDGFTVSQTLEDGRLWIKNTQSGSYDSNAQKNQLGYVYSVRSNYRVADVDYASGDIIFPKTDISYGAASVCIWLGETEETVSGIRISNTSDAGRKLNGIGLQLVAIDKTTGTMYTQNDVGKGKTVGSASGVWHFEYTYSYNYSTGIYKYNFTISNPEGKSASPIVLSTHTNFLKYRDLISRDFGFSVATDVSKGGAAAVDNIVCEFDNGFDDEGKFNTDHSLTLHLQADTVSYQDKEYVDNAISAYEGSLPLREKYLFKLPYKRFLELRTKINEYYAASVTDEDIKRKSNDYSEWSADFTDEKDLRKFVSMSGISAETGDQDCKISLYDDNGTATAKLTGTAAGVYTPKSYTLPEKAAASEVTFKIKAAPSTVTPSDYPDDGERRYDENSRFNIYFNYTDSDNYEAYKICPNKQGQWGTQYIARKDGMLYGNVGFNPIKDIDFTKWVEVIMTYSDTNVVINFIQADNEEISGTVTKTLLSGKSIPAISVSNNIYYRHSLLVSDFKMTLKKGTFIEDDTQSDPVVYYTGDTVYKAGETVLVSGEDLYKTVSTVKLAKVPETFDPTKAKYVFETDYKNGSKRAKGKYFETASAAELDGFTWTDMKILQWTEDSFKFVIPETMGNGVYVMKITGRNGSEKYFYINNPVISYTTGDEGSAVTAGGTLEIVGKSLAPYAKENGGSNTAVQFRNKTGETVATLTAAAGQLTVDSEYNITAKIPENMKTGNYEISVYNGFGDNCAWSEPADVTVTKPIRDSWGANANGEKYVIDITSLGATGSRQQNATPYFVDAFELLAENGGGTLYLPKGWYQLQFSLVIPENVEIVGDGHSDTIIYWLPLKWQYYNLPSYAFGFNSNISVSGVTLFATRLAKLFQCFDSAPENVYFSDIKFYKPTFHGTATSAADGSGIILDGYSAQEIQLRLRDEQSNTYGGAVWWFPSSIKNFQADDFDVEIDGSTTLGSYWNSFTYANVRNCNWKATAFNGQTGSNVVYKNCSWDGISQANGSTARYYSGCEFKNITTNNHEFSVADEGMIWGADNIGIMTQISDTVYELKNKTFNENGIKNRQVYVLTGQGAGQVRKIVANSGSRIQVDNPFEVAPNGNSRVVICQPRTDHFFYNNTYHNGSCGTYFGNVAGAIFDSNKHTRHGGFCFHARVSMPNWYCSVKDDSFSEPMYLHTMGDADQSGQAELQLYSRSGTNGLKGIMIKGNSFDGYSIMTYDGGAAKGMVDFVIEDNRFMNVSTAIGSCGAKGSVDGIYYANNTFSNVDVGYGNYAAQKRIGYNKQGSPLVYYANYSGSEAYLLGDVNLDGEVTLKDVSLIRYYLLGKAELNELQIANADVYPDGKITAKDATVIRNYVLGIISTFDGITADSEPEYSSDTSSSSSGSESSSSSSSSGGSSSGSSSSGSSSSGSSSSGSSGSSSGSSSSSSSDDGEFYPGYY